MPEPSSDLQVAEGLAFALVDGEGLILDVNADRYVALDAIGARVWLAFSGGRDRIAAADVVANDCGLSADQARAEVDGCLEAWQQSGLVTGRPPLSAERLRFKPLVPDRLDAVPAEMLASARPSPRVLCRLILAWRWTAKTMAQGIRPAFEALQAAAPAPPTTDTAGQLSTICTIVRAFGALRLPFNQGADDCLPRSIHLARALHRSGIPADVCFGVRKFPFAAHAWVESCGFLLAESTSTVAQLARIARF